MSLDLKGKVVVITGAGGVICSTLAKSLAVTGAKIALLDLNVDAANVVANEIVANGYIAKAYKVNVLDKTSIEDAHAAIKADLGECNILINGAGGNNPKATTDNEYCAFEKDVEKDFFDLKEEGVKFVLI